MPTLAIGNDIRYCVSSRSPEVVAPLLHADAAAIRVVGNLDSGEDQDVPRPGRKTLDGAFQPLRF